MITKWLPWKYVVRRVARGRGFIDPISVLSRLHSLAEPSEVAAPLELLRAGVVFHARGLMNASVIQHNRDWIWPFWIERQFNPEDDAFLPRAFSITHVNLTHRNWTAVGIPGCDQLPIVDPRGLLTPFWDGWSIDGWIFRNDGCRLIPSRERLVSQSLNFEDGLSVTTKSHHGEMELSSNVAVRQDATNAPLVEQHWQATSDAPAWLLLAVRPYNPEGVSFVHRIQLDDDGSGWSIGDHGRVRFSRPVDEHFTSDYKHGDVAALVWNDGAKSVDCPVGMATAAAAFQLKPNELQEVTLQVPLQEKSQQHWLGHTVGKSLGRSIQPTQANTRAWSTELQQTSQLDVPDDRFRFLHDAAIRTIALHSPGEVYPGPFTYKRFWVRDTAFILNAALCAGLHDRVNAAIPHLLKRQERSGYFHSQDGEWDSNGQALWLLERSLRFQHKPFPATWRGVVKRAADWIERKRIPTSADSPARGLLPAGFSAEHLGPNDFYFWDDFWAVAGLKAAARLMQQSHERQLSARYTGLADDISKAIHRSLERTDYMRDTFAFPAAPERRMDAGAIGSLVATYPLQLVASDDKRMQGTIQFLLENCMVDGGFFQDMIHSGINPYLTLHLAQALLRNGDISGFDLINTVSKLASDTGQWPEAIHPRTNGGCMGDGQHVWAAAEWLLAVRNMFVREEENSLVLGSGIPPSWHYAEETLRYGPTWTPWGRLSLEFEFKTEQATVSWHTDWHATAPLAEIRIPCFEAIHADLSEKHGRIVVRANHSCNLNPSPHI